MSKKQIFVTMFLAIFVAMIGGKLLGFASTNAAADTQAPVISITPSAIERHAPLDLPVVDTSTAI